jgi:putative membrane-bound dehydrogenase-like protein
MKRTIQFAFLIMAFILINNCKESTPKDKGKFPLELYLPDELQVELWAESPLFYNPTNMDTDAKGRIWITEGMNYRKFANDSTFYKDTLGDRVVILEDVDQDGDADSSKVFVQDKDLVAPLGIAVMGNEVYVSCAPHLIKYTDTNGDDKADKKEIILTGFGGHDHDHSLHSIVGGPDGKYYFNVGNAGPHNVTDKAGWTLRSGSVYTGGSPYNEVNAGNQKSDDGKVYVGGIMMSMNRDATGLKVLGHNFRNSYETYVDGRREMWQNDNDDQVVACRVSWLVEGGNAGFFSNDGTRSWQADQRPGQSMPTAHWHMEDPGIMPPGDISGAGSPTGMVRLEGSELGEKYKGMVLSVDAGRNVLFSYQPKQNSSGYDLNGLRKIFLSSNKADDEGYQWNNEKFAEDKSKWFRPSDAMIGTDGALYVADWFDAVVGGHQIKDKEAYGRIYRITPKGKKLNTPKLDFNSQEGLFTAMKNPAVNVRFMATNKLAEQGAGSFDAIMALTKDKNEFTKARAIWLLARMGDKGKSKLIEYLNDGNEDEKVIAFRALRSITKDGELATICGKAVASSFPFLRREAALAMENIPYVNKKDMLITFAKQSPVGDAFYANTILQATYKYEDVFVKDLLASDVNQKIKNQYAMLLHTPSSFAILNSMTMDSTDKVTQHQAITALSFINTKEAVDFMLNLRKSADSKIKEMADYWVAFRSSNDWAGLYNWSSINKDIKTQQMLTAALAAKEKLMNKNIALPERKWATANMANNEVGARLVIEMIKNKTFPTDLIDKAIEELMKSKDETIKMQAATILPSDDASAYNEKEILSGKANVVNGQAVYKKYCALCHKHNAIGNSIGPELTKIHEKLDKTGLYEAIVNPNSSIVFGYESWTINTKDGNVFTGFILSENPKSIVVKDMAGKSNTIAIVDISKKEKSTKSMMPSAKAYNISKEDLRDLIGWLKNEK